MMRYIHTVFFFALVFTTLSLSAMEQSFAPQSAPDQENIDMVISNIIDLVEHFDKQHDKEIVASIEKDLLNTIPNESDTTDIDGTYKKLLEILNSYQCTQAYESLSTRYELVKNAAIEKKESILYNPCQLKKLTLHGCIQSDIISCGDHIVTAAAALEKAVRDGITHDKEIKEIQSTLLKTMPAIQRMPDGRLSSEQLYAYAHALQLKNFFVFGYMQNNPEKNCLFFSKVPPYNHSFDTVDAIFKHMHSGTAQSNHAYHFVYNQQQNHWILCSLIITKNDFILYFYDSLTGELSTYSDTLNFRLRIIRSIQEGKNLLYTKPIQKQKRIIDIDDEYLTKKSKTKEIINLD